MRIWLGPQLGVGVLLAALVSLIVACRVPGLPCTGGKLRPMVDRTAVSCRCNGRLRACMGGLGSLIPDARFRKGAMRRVITSTPSKTVFGGTKRMLGRALCFLRFAPGPGGRRPSNGLTRTVGQSFKDFRGFGGRFGTTSAKLFNSN